MREPTRVYVTVDVECAEERIVRGRPQPPLGYDLRVFGRFANQREELGIGLLMGDLEARGFRGTFFVEPFGSRFFGKEGLAEVVGSLRSRGHDVQIHTHPIQKNPVFRSQGVEPQPDDIAAYSVLGQTKLLDEARRLLEDAGAPKGSLLAFRAGNFGASNETWEAMAKAGIPLSSNYNPCYWGKRSQMRWAAAEAGLFAAPAPGVFELPITCFRESKGYRHLQIAAVSAAEMEECLWQCRALGIGEVTIVTHSFELYFIDDAARAHGRINAVNLERFRRVLAFLARHRDDFRVETVGELAARLPMSPGVPRRRYPRGRPLLRALRFAEQLKKRAAALADV